MTEPAQAETVHPLLVLCLGLVAVVAALLKSRLARLGVPALVAFIAMGFLLRLVDTRWNLLVGHGRLVFDALARLGVICLLFRVGLESDLGGLLSQLRRALCVFAGNVVVSGGLGYVAARHVLGLDLAPGLFVAVAMMATSVGVAVAVWQDADALDSPRGRLLVDTAELDDIWGVVAMALLLAVAEGWAAQAEDGADLAAAAVTLGGVTLKLLGFGALCILFSKYVEKPLTRWVERLEKPPDPMLTVAGVAIVFAALAGLLGFSAAIGAFFAGLVFSRDPDAVRMDASFQAVYDLLVPFFFVGIGLAVMPGALVGSLGLGAVLLAAAVIGKVVGTAAPALAFTGGRGAALVGLSMVPRAEITMIVMEKGRTLGNAFVPPAVFGGMVLVVMATCLTVPLAVRRLLHMWPQTENGAGED